MSEFSGYKERHSALQTELQESVPMAEYERLKETLNEMSVQVEQMQEQIRVSKSRSENDQKQVEDLMGERKELFEKCLASEQALSDVKRDCELKEIKIESLQNIIQKREQQAISGQSQKFTKGAKKEQAAQIEKLEQDKRKLQDEVGRMAVEIQRQEQQLKNMHSIKEARDK